MAQWQKTQIRRDNGEMADAQAPMIISASRSTDIPAFYADWFFHRLKVGYSAWTNPFNGVKSFVSYEKCRFIVFWSKNPEPLLEHLDELKERDIGCYLQYTLNDYEKEGLEKGVPPLEQRIDTFKRLVDRLGQGRLIWRFDPLILTDQISMDDLLTKMENIGDQLQGYTEKLVFSYADIALYKKVKANLENSKINYSEWSPEQMVGFAKRLVELNKTKGWNYALATCGEAADLDGVEHNRCIDDDLMIRFASHDKTLMDFLGVEITEGDLFNPKPTIIKHRNNRDKGQRQFCGCIMSKDIGEYNTCPHLCEYCYANASKEKAIENYKKHETNPLGETIKGKKNQNNHPKRISLLCLQGSERKLSEIFSSLLCYSNILIIFAQQKPIIMKEYKQDENADDLVKEPTIAYEEPASMEEMTTVIDEEMDIDVYYERNKEAIEAANERIHRDKTKAPKGYYTLEEFDELFKKKLSEAYGTL